MSTVTPNTDTQAVEDLNESRDVLLLPSKPAPFTDEERELAAREGLRSLETRWVNWDQPRPADGQAPDGCPYRTAGVLYIRTCKDGVRRFVAYMYPESTHHDFRYFDRIMTLASGGRMEGWSRRTFKDGDEGWFFDYQNIRMRQPNGEPLPDPIPAGIIDDETWGYRCDEPACREKYHDEIDGNHTHEALERELNKYSNYEIEIVKDGASPDSDWYLNVWTGSNDMTELTPEQLATYVNDLNWMAIECQTLNAKEGRK